MQSKPKSKFAMLHFGPAPTPTHIPSQERASLKGLDVADSDFMAWVEAGGELPSEPKTEPKKPA